MIDARGHGLLAERLDALPAVLDATLAHPLAPLPDALRRAALWTVTATGASEGPARALAALLTRHTAHRAVFAPLSCFAVDAPPSSEVLVVVSQGLSPNARLALAARDRYARCVLITASRGPEVESLSRDGVLVLSHGPDDEPRLLLRVQGPAAAMLTALRLVDALAVETRWFRDDTRDALARALRRCATPTFDGPLTCALVTGPDDGDFGHAHRSVWLEGVGTCDPGTWDVLQFAHGPYQHVVDRATTLVTFERANGASRALFDRLASMLDPARHTLVRLVATLPGPLAYFEHAAMLGAVVRQAARLAARDLMDWPGRGRDGALYDLGADALASTSTRACADE